jgi:sugar transferase (PEP-CTERM/EpsH1 system associated)
MNPKPLIAHVLYRLDTGGLERTLVTVINGTHERYRHALICLAGFSAFREQIAYPDVACETLNKQPGKDWGCYFRAWRILMRLRPDLVLTYNYGAMDLAPIAKFAGVRRVVHAERGRDVSDLRGESRKYRAIRRGLRPFVDRYLAVSQDIRTWLVDTIGIDAARVTYIPNAVDIEKFHQARPQQPRSVLGNFAPAGTIVIGTVGRLVPVKDHVMLLSAFDDLRKALPQYRSRLRLAIVGEGPQRAMLEQTIRSAALEDSVCLAGNRTDIPELLAEFDLFALTSLAEGMPNVILEAMAAGLPVVATAVGGVPDVVSNGVTGTLVPAANAQAFTQALSDYVTDEPARTQHGQAARKRAESTFSLPVMLYAYAEFYDEMLAQRHGRASRSSSPLTEYREH